MLRNNPGGTKKKKPKLSPGYPASELRIETMTSRIRSNSSNKPTATSLLSVHSAFNNIFMKSIWGVSKGFRTESITKYTLTTIKATQRVMAAKLTRLTHKITTQLHLTAEICTICSSRARWSVRKLLDTFGKRVFETVANRFLPKNYLPPCRSTCCGWGRFQVLMTPRAILAGA